MVHEEMKEVKKDVTTRKAPAEIINALFNGVDNDRFRSLFVEGQRGNKSQAEADTELCTYIAYYADNDEELISEIYEMSKLKTDKWSDAEYRSSIIKLAVDRCDDHAHKMTVAKIRPAFILEDSKGHKEFVSAPLLAKHVRSYLPYVYVKDAAHDDPLLYVYVDGYYQLHTRDMMLGRIKIFIEEYDETLVKIRTLNEVMRLLETDLTFVDQEDLNIREDIINFRNGLLNTKTMELLPHTPDIISTIQLPCDWTGEPQPTPVFDSYLRTLTNGANDVIHLLQAFIGVCISNVRGYRFKKALFLVGDGDTGKSVLKSLMERLLGRGNYIGIDLRDIEARFGTGVIYGKSLAGSADMSFMSLKELKTFKSLTGGDSVFAEFKNGQGFTYTYTGMLCFCMNQLPKFGGDNGEWVYNRIIVVNCNNVIPEDKQDKELLDKLMAEREGIIYKAVTALQHVIDDGYRLPEPASVVDARREYMISNSSVKLFFDECMFRPTEKLTSAKCTTGAIFKVYKAWCQDNNNGYAVPFNEFKEELSKYVGVPYQDMIVRINGQSYFKDYTLNLEAKKQYVKAYGYDTSSLISTKGS